MTYEQWDLNFQLIFIFTFDYDASSSLLINHFIFLCLEIHKNSYQPTYTFPEDFNGDSDQMEDYIRKTANPTTQGQYSRTIDLNNWIEIIFVFRLFF